TSLKVPFARFSLLVNALHNINKDPMSAAQSLVRDTHKHLLFSSQRPVVSPLFEHFVQRVNV
ncbi:MAG: hypothetical protein IKV45_01465, partial [Firmicutes bacterium]|nr:hypothetical protein [Bacillota bacterium]